MGGTNKDIELKSFFVFNSLYGPKEGEELQKILYYYPITDNTDVQIKNVGLVQGIIQFTETFKPDSPVSSLHTNKIRQLYFQPECNFWVVMTLSLPIVTKIKENTSSVEYLEEGIQDNVYDAVLQQAYYMYRLFWGTFQCTIEQHDLGTLKTRLQVFFNAYLKTLKLANSDILNIFGGIQYLPLDRQTFLKVQCFINLLESSWDCLEHTAFLYNEHVIWSGIDPSDMKIIYQYLIGTLLPANVETELQGGSMPRNSPSPFAALRYGRFITGPTNLKQAKTVGKVPKVYLFSSGKAKEYHYLVYRALSATVCLFVKGEVELTLDFFKSLDVFINPRLTSIVTDIAEYCSRQVVSPCNIPESSPRFIYFNKMNLAYKSTVHLDNKQTGNIACSKDSLRIMADMKAKNHLLGHAGESIVKTMNDYWVVGKNSNLKEFYIVLQQKNASLIEISERIGITGPSLRFPFPGNGTWWYTNGSKQAGVGVFCRKAGFRAHYSLGLLDVIQVEVYAILQYGYLNLATNYQLKTINICSGSRAARQAIKPNTVDSCIVSKCKDESGGPQPITPIPKCAGIGELKDRLVCAMLERCSRDETSQGACRSSKYTTYYGPSNSQQK